jgi:uncharacterized pyridoxamine 5'-phosphate oxidase family protein
MKTVVDFLKKSQVQYFSTIGLDGKPKVRPFQFALEDDGKIYYCTSNQKPVFKQMQANPNVEICASGENFSWLRLSGKAIFVDDLKMKAKVQEAMPMVKSIYKTPDNTIFELFYLEDAVAVITDFSGNPPKTIKL